MNEREEQDLEMMRNPGFWPLAVLPVTRYDHEPGEPGTGIMLPSGPAVYLVDMFQGPVSVQELQDAERIDYEDYESALADGWRVD